MDFKKVMTNITIFKEMKNQKIMLNTIYNGSK